MMLSLVPAIELLYASSFRHDFDPRILKLTHQGTTTRHHETLLLNTPGRSGLPLPSPEHPRLESTQEERPKRMLQTEPRRWKCHRDILLEEQGYGQ